MLEELTASRADFERIAALHPDCPEAAAVRSAFDGLESDPAATSALEEAFIAFRRACALAMGPTESVEANLIAFRIQLCIDDQPAWEALA
ncbi:MAG: hypothetical protein ACYCW6_10100 [Candidatus Xenobia bacterium]